MGARTVAIRTWEVGAAAVLGEEEGAAAAWRVQQGQQKRCGRERSQQVKRRGTTARDEGRRRIAG